MHDEVRSKLKYVQQCSNRYKLKYVPTGTQIQCNLDGEKLAFLMSTKGELSGSHS